MHLDCPPPPIHTHTYIPTHTSTDTLTLTLTHIGTRKAMCFYLKWWLISNEYPFAPVLAGVANAGVISGGNEAGGCVQARRLCTAAHGRARTRLCTHTSWLVGWGVWGG